MVVCRTGRFLFQTIVFFAGLCALSVGAHADQRPDRPHTFQEISRVRTELLKKREITQNHSANLMSLQDLYSRIMTAYETSHSMPLSVTVPRHSLAVLKNDSIEIFHYGYRKQIQMAYKPPSIEDEVVSIQFASEEDLLNALLSISKTITNLAPEAAAASKVYLKALNEHANCEERIWIEPLLSEAAQDLQNQKEALARLKSMPVGDQERSDLWWQQNIYFPVTYMGVNIGLLAGLGYFLVMDSGVGAGFVLFGGAILSTAVMVVGDEMTRNLRIEIDDAIKEAKKTIDQPLDRIKRAYFTLETVCDEPTPYSVILHPRS